MVRLISILLLSSIISFALQGQKIRVDYVEAEDSIKIGSGKVTEVSNDATLADSSETAIPTEAAIKGYVDNNANSTFNGNRSILRVPQSGQNLGTATVTDWLEWWYFTPPTVSLSKSPNTQYYEIGTSNEVIFSIFVNNAGGSTLSNGRLDQTSPSTVTLGSFGSSISFADTITFTPQQGGSGQYNELSYNFRGYSQYDGPGSEDGTAQSTIQLLNGVYPVFYGVSATDFSDTGAYPGGALGTGPYLGFTKLITNEKDLSGVNALTLNGTGFAYVFLPDTWVDNTLDIIRDQNDFNVTAAWTQTTVTISSTGLTNDYSTVSYKMYKANVSATYNSDDYDFVR